MAVEVVMEVGGMSSCAAHVTATVRVLRPAAWPSAGVVSPVLDSSAHGLVPMSEPWTVMVSVAVAVPLFVNSADPLEPLPHPECVENVMAVDLPVMLGSTRMI
jgi:hypothetical protein